MPRMTTLVEASPEALIYEQEVVGNEDERAALIVVPMNGVDVAAFGGEGNSAGVDVPFKVEAVDASIVNAVPLPDDDGPLVLSAAALQLEAGDVDEVLLEGNQIDLNLLAQGKSSNDFDYFQMKGAVKKNVELDFFQKSCPFSLITASQLNVPRNENVNKVGCVSTKAVTANKCDIPPGINGETSNEYICFYTTVTVTGPNVKQLIPIYEEAVEDERFRRVLVAESPNGYNIESRNWVILPPKDNASCSAAPLCRDLTGNCCPTNDGVLLNCCNDERRPTARPNPSPTRRPTNKPTYSGTTWYVFILIPVPSYSFLLFQISFNTNKFLNTTTDCSVSVFVLFCCRVLYVRFE